MKYKNVEQQQQNKLANDLRWFLNGFSFLAVCCVQYRERKMPSQGRKKSANLLPETKLIFCFLFFFDPLSL